MKQLVCAAGCLGLLLAGALWAGEEKKDVAKLPPAAARTIDFQRDIQPILARACISCHGPDKQRAGLRLDERTEAMKGGNSGSVIKPGDGAHSRLVQLVAGLDPELKMPPEGKPPLSAEEMGQLRAWIDQGASWAPSSPTATGPSTKSSHWSFKPLKRLPAPPVTNQAWIRNDIDAFVLARLERRKIAPSPEADRATLIRRLSLDLLGLPPTPREVDDFIKDARPDAYEQLVDRMLASPHYGERWGRHWLDLARYADSDGFEKDTGRPYAWRWRNWVIEAFNRNLPFDQFTIEQLAGDLLPDATLEQKIATGFHRNTLTNKEGGVDKEQFRVEAVVDRVSTTAKVFLGVTMNCCQCHDHKYDPFTQREFYQMFAFFDSDKEVELPVLLPAEEEAFNKKKAAYDKKRAELQKAVAEYKKTELPKNQRQWESELKPADLERLPENISAILNVEAEERTPEQKKELAAHYAKDDTKLAALTKAVTAHAKTEPKAPSAQTLAMGPARKTHVMIRGDFLRPGVEVQAATPAVLPPLKTTDHATRLDLARWIVDPANPLTPRVITNWMWHKYFGRGIVPTLEDFGTQGERPSHPELLDWLATEFVRLKWDKKAMHKVIVTSATYRQSSKARPELATRDPLNVLLARQSRTRLEAEILRDVALASSGLLVRTIGGPSVRPPQPAGISELSYANTVKWVESTGPDRYRRGMYTWFQRTSPYPMLMTFDAPDSNVCCVRRERSNTPLQALTLLNDTTFVECAQALGRRLVEEQPGEEERIRHAFRLCLAREPSSRELESLGKLFQDLLAQCRANPTESGKLFGDKKPAGAESCEAAAWVALARAIMNLDEFVTRE